VAPVGLLIVRKAATLATRSAPTLSAPLAL
jgi:hypothetical protein